MPISDRHCLVCGANWIWLREYEVIKAGVFFRCSVCGLQFFDPMPNQPMFADFSEYGKDLLDQHPSKLLRELTSVERAALRYIRRAVKPFGCLLEICFESGRFLAHLRHEGYQTFGVDPISNHVRNLADKGYTVALGLVEELPKDWPEPDAVIMLESLVRFPKPVRLLTSIRERFVMSPLIVSVPSPHRSLRVPEFDRRTDYPPHQLTRWSRKALVEALGKAGYVSKCVTVRVDLSKYNINPLLKKAAEIGYRILGESEYSYLAIARPNNGSKEAIRE